MADKLEMMSTDIIQENIDYIANKFPNALKEVKEDGKIVKKIDFDVLKQELSRVIIDDKQERYQMTWPDKKKSILLANSRINATLRPDKEKSLDFDNTKNLYIEGDNLDALKLLRETYLGKVKLIYIDPPYNTGSDFVYNDNFVETEDDYITKSGEIDDYGNKLVVNNDSNGRFHTDWLNMMYPRLKIAKDMLTDDGLIMVSIDDNEHYNLVKLMCEIFGQKNYLGTLIWEKKRKGSFLSKRIVSLTEYCVVFSRNVNSNVYLYGGKADETESQPIIKRTNSLSVLNFAGKTVKTKIADCTLKAGIYGEDVNPVKLLNDVVVKNGCFVNDFSLEAHFTWSQKFLQDELSKGSYIVINTCNLQPRAFRKYDDSSFKGLGSIIDGVKISGTNEDAYEELEKIFGIKKLFDYSKPTNYIKTLVKAATYFDPNAIVMDFFSGSATTAQAIFENNIEDSGNRRVILVQLPEKVDSSEYKTICDIGEERIRRIANKIKKENGKAASELDLGFRVLKLDSSNMADVYYNPNKTEQNLLESLVDNVKEGRTGLDLLFQVMLELGIELSAKIEEKTLAGKKCFIVNENDIVACFENDVSGEAIKEMAKIHSIYAVFKDSGFASDAANINCEQIFKSVSPSTNIKII